MREKRKVLERGSEKGKNRRGKRKRKRGVSPSTF